jgi:hypothetical protein
MDPEIVIEVQFTLVNTIMCSDFMIHILWTSLANLVRPIAEPSSWREDRRNFKDTI